MLITRSVPEYRCFQRTSEVVFYPLDWLNDQLRPDRFDGAKEKYDNEWM